MIHVFQKVQFGSSVLQHGLQYSYSYVQVYAVQIIPVFALLIKLQKLKQILPCKKYVFIIFNFEI